MELVPVETTPLQTQEPIITLIAATTVKHIPEEGQLKVKTTTITAIDNKATIQETKVPLQDPTVVLLMEEKAVADLMAEEAEAAAAAVVQDHQEEAEDK